MEPRPTPRPTKKTPSPTTYKPPPIVPFPTEFPYKIPDEPDDDKA